jgi:hypothetical protein
LNAFHAAIGVGVLATRTHEGASIIGLTLVDVDDPERHPTLRTERATVRHFKRRAIVAIQQHVSPSSSGESSPSLGL